MAKTTQKLTFTGSQNNELAARLDLPAGAPTAYILFAHCFTCSKDIFAASRISGKLADLGFAVLRFDFTGLGASEGEFANTSFSSNVEDLVKAADYLRENHEAPQILVGHSLGGAAVLSAAEHIPEAVAVATIGAPSNAEHVVHNFGARLDEIEQRGVAEVQLAGRPFTIKKQFLDDLKSQSVKEKVARLGKALIVFHAPLDETVGIENAADIFQAAKHPKSFVSLDNADHLLSKREDAAFVASVLSAWTTRYLPQQDNENTNDQSPSENAVIVEENKIGKYSQTVSVDAHKLTADEPVSLGGNDTGPKPHDFLSIGLGACTSITLRMYAERKKLNVKNIKVAVTRRQIRVRDEANKERNVVSFDREIEIKGDLDEATRNRMLHIADRCPVHRTLETGSEITTKLKE